MKARALVNRALLPVVGTVTAAATLIGVRAPVSQAASTSPDTGDAALRTEGASVPVVPTAEGTFESCSAYFGLGKESGVVDVGSFDVSDVNGADGVDHAVGDDVEVVLVLENDEGDILECLPEDITQDEWEDEFGTDSSVPDWPGPGHFAYPSVDMDPWIDDFGEVDDVGFRVVSVPDGHTLVAPTGIKELRETFLDPESLVFGGVIDPRVQALIGENVDDAAAAAFEDVIGQCAEGEDEPALSDPDFLAAIEFLGDYADDERSSEPGCFDAGLLNAEASYLVSALEAAAYSEPITLSLPVPAQPPAPPAVQPAAQAVVATPTFTG